ncbi:MAG: fused protease/ribonucleoside-triphosphate reductase [Promethearchaeota archaeon]|nr:MAG: fused protease/ribonucleoside-triphosphate reductase [Candidatus Lokiarchaeota archaeon]
MVQSIQNDNHEIKFSLNSIFPRHIRNSRGDIKPFNPDKMVKSLNKETGLDWDECIQVVKDSLKRITVLGLEIIQTSMIRETLCLDLLARNHERERHIYAKLINSSVIKFRLDPEFIDQYRGKQPEWGPLGYITYKRTYARFNESENRTEEFYETAQRVVEGVYSIQKEHCFKLGLPWDHAKAQKSAQRMFEKIWTFRFLPPGRGLWMMGTEFIDKHGSMALNNCGFVSTKDIEIKKTKAFEWLMDALMLGVGVGFDTKGAGKFTIKEPKDETVVFEVPDSREGWVQALRHLLTAYFEGEAMPIYDFSKVRSAGSLIRGFGGVASGPGPLNEMLNSQKEILDNLIGKTLSSVDIVDMMNLIGKCVVAGNVRRSAEIALGDLDDEAYITCKQDQEALYHHRWASNNSIIGKRGMDYDRILEGIAKNGEPGIIWLENAQAYSRMGHPRDDKDKNAVGVNPCGEQTLESFELCCLVETFPSRHESYEEFEETLKYAYLYAKSVTLVNVHWNETNAVMGKNRRIGTSQTGIIDAFARHGRNTILQWSDRGYNFLRQQDEQYSEFFCVPQSIKITTVKPSGTVSLLPGVAPGIHYPHSEYYIRRIRISKESTLIDLLREANYHIEQDAYSDNSMVVEFPIHEKNFLRAKKDVSIWEQLANAVDYQHYWSDNQVSITATFQKDEIKDLKYALQFVEDKLKGISLLPLTDSGYKQMPYEEITKEDFQVRSAPLKPIKTWITHEKSVGTVYCDGDSCHQVEEANVLREMEAILNEKIPAVNEITSNTFGFNVQNGIIIEVGLANKQLSDLPENFSQLTHLRRLTLKNCGLKQIPEGMIHFSNIEFVDLSGNILSDLSDVIKSWIESLRTAGKTVIL